MISRWRAVANIHYHKEKKAEQALITLGSSKTHILSLYYDRFFTNLDPEVQANCRSVFLQTWFGKEDRGWWCNMGVLRLPRMREGYF